MTVSDPHYTVLVTTLHQWDKRWRIQKILIWLPRLLLIPLGFGIALAVFARFSPIFAPQDILIITIVAIVAFIAGFLGWFLLRQRDPLVSARYFDSHFNLQERLSTALELMDGTIHGDAGLVSAQIADAQTHATEFAYKRHLALVIRRLDWAIMVGVCVILAILLILPNPNTQTIQQAQAQQQQIDESAEEVKDLIEDIANDASLDSATREELLQALQVTLETLENPDVSAEEALATISDAQSLLEEKSQEAEGRSEAQQEALERALEAMQNAQNPAESLEEALQNMEEELAEQQTAQDENSSSENQSGEQSEENQSRAESLRNAAEQLRESNPSVAQSLEQAAQALDENDQQSAQEAIEDAQEQLEQNPNQQQNEQAAQNLQEAAQQMQEQQQEMAQQQQQGQQQQQEQEQAQNQQQGQNQEGEQQQQGQQNQSENPESQNEGDSNQTGDAQGENPSNSENPSQSESDEISQSDSESQSQQNQQAQGTTLDNNSPTDNLGGDNDADLSQDTSGLTLNEVDQQQGNADEVRGEAQYEAVFAPQRMGGQGEGEEIILAPDVNDENLREGDFTDNESGNLTVPYNEVFNNYLGNANTALETGYIPLGLRDVIRQYFTSLAPRTAPSQDDN